jgi:NAD(P)-dependent dehydrogenase (short-subunit alcohol dehydrogenase family)
MVKGTFLVTQQFLQLNGKASAGTIINITSAAALNSTPCLSSYSLSKLCQIQLQAFVRAENPNVRAVSLHPGILMTRMTPPRISALCARYISAGRWCCGVVSD